MHKGVNFFLNRKKHGKKTAPLKAHSMICLDQQN